MTRAPTKPMRIYRHTIIRYHPDYRSKFTGTPWRWSAGNLYANTLADIKALIREQEDA